MKRYRKENKIIKWFVRGHIKRHYTYENRDDEIISKIRPYVLRIEKSEDLMGWNIYGTKVQKIVTMLLFGEYFNVKSKGRNDKI